MKEIIRKLNKTNENHVFSPAALQYALMLLAKMTAGKSQKEILDVLGIEEEKLSNEIRKMERNLNEKSYESVVSMNSSFWMNEKMNIRNDASEKFDGTMICSGKMGSEEFDESIQHWVNAKTNNLLKDNVKNIHTKSSELLKLITAIYLKGCWDHKFEECDTKTATFHVSDSHEEKCDFMNNYMRSRDLLIGKHFTAMEMFLGCIGEMTFILPNEGLALEDIANDEDLLDCLNGKTNKLKRRIYNIHLSLPKFDIMSDGDILGQIKQLGIVSVTDEKEADFSGITDEKGLFLNSAVQASRLKINEKGVEAASYVEMVMVTGCCLDMHKLKDIDFVLDRPFMFSFVKGGMPLFVGTINNPNQK